MNEAIVYLFGIGLVALIFAFIVMNVRNEHAALKYFLIAMLLVLSMMIPSAMFNARENCETVVSNSTIVDSITTSYEYESFCFTTTTKTPETFYSVISWVYYIVIGYLVISVTISAILELLPNKKIKL